MMRAGGDHGGREHQLLVEEGGDATRPGPVGAVGEPADDLTQEVHVRPYTVTRRERLHGSATRSMPTQARSKRAASATESTSPTMIGV